MDPGWSKQTDSRKWTQTPKNEKSPFIHSDSQTLYFASDGLPNLGGYDIFYSKNDDDTKAWIEPVNIGYPINTTADEIGLFVSLNGKRAYFNSNKLKGVGGWDLYEFDLYESARPEKVALLKGVLKGVFGGFEREFGRMQGDLRGRGAPRHARRPATSCMTFFKDTLSP